MSSTYHNGCLDLAGYKEVSRQVYESEAVVSYQCREDSNFMKQIHYSDSTYDITKGMTLTFTYYKREKQGISETYIMGRLSEKKYFTAGVEDGPDTAFFENGKVFRASSWRKGRPSDVLVEYFSNGVVSRRAYFDTTGSLLKQDDFDSTGRYLTTEDD